LAFEFKSCIEVPAFAKNCGGQAGRWFSCNIVSLVGENMRSSYMRKKREEQK